MTNPNDPELPKSEKPQSKGGAARAAKLTKAELSAAASKAAKARWAAKRALQDPARIPEAICEGGLQIGDVGIDCYVLDNLTRVIHKRGMAKALGMKSTGGNAFLKTMNRKGLGSAIPAEIWADIDNPLIFKPLNGDPGHGYKATLLIDICAAIIDADRAGKLHPNQHFLAIQAEIIIRASAKLGIVALVDDATGFISDRRREKYRELYQTFVTDEIRRYDPEFDKQLFDVIYKLYGLSRGPHANRHPQFFGHFIRRYIYKPLASSRGAILELLDDKNPVVYVNGGRRYKMHQFLSDVVGLPALRAHFWQIVGIGNSVKTKAQFDRAFLNAFPSMNPDKQIPLDFGEDSEDPILN